MIIKLKVVLFEKKRLPEGDYKALLIPKNKVRYLGKPKSSLNPPVLCSWSERAGLLTLLKLPEKANKGIEIPEVKKYEVLTNLKPGKILTKTPVLVLAVEKEVDAFGLFCVLRKNGLPLMPKTGLN